jgi:hypothetical protein
MSKIPPAGRRAVPLLLAALLAACSGSREATEPPPVDPTPVYPDYETFDPSGYDAQPASAPAEVQHDVPPRLMEGRVAVPDGSGGERVVDGYRVQIFSSDSRDAAEGVRTQAEGWWRSVQSQSGAPDDLSPTVAYLQPYYRVRVGGFEFRDEAEAALPFVRARFPEAFIVPDRVTITD